MTAICRRFDRLGIDNPGVTYRLGIMGGTFDPIHLGHLACAEQARESARLDAVLFVPAGNPVFKRDQQLAPAQMRLEMCRLAVESNPAFDVSAIEIDRVGDTYTVDTLRQLRAHFPENVELFLITGADALMGIMKWRDSSAIADMARLIAVTRPGFTLTDEWKRDLAACADFEISYVSMPALSLSSTMLRNRVAHGHSIRYLTVAPVVNYIQENGLYRHSASVGCVPTDRRCDKNQDKDGHDRHCR